MTEAPKRGRPRKAALEGAAADPVPGDNGKALTRIVEFFKQEHPEAWERIRLHPLQHGIEDMAALL